MINIICPKCKGNEWVIKEEICINQDCLSVECECNTIGCGERKDIFIDIEARAEDFNNK